MRKKIVRVSVRIPHIHCAAREITYLRRSISSNYIVVMPPLSKLARMDTKARAFLETAFANAPAYHAEMLDLWTTFCDLKLPNDDFIAEFTNGKKPSLAQRTWEMLLARHLHRIGYHVVCPNGGPDFRFDLNGTTVWVEAVSPTPVGLPAEWLDPNFQGVCTFPHEKILLRWTTALDAKWKKLQEYQQKGTVKATDSYVVAINGSQLSTVPESRGITQIPFGVETVFPVGPLAYRVNNETNKIGNPFISERFHITNSNKSNVRTTPFVNPAYAGVSALIGCAADRCHGKLLPIHVVHNPRAAVPLPLGSLGGQDDEWFATPVTGQIDEFDLQQVSPPSGA